MPFGRFRGERLEDVPDAYVRWLLAIELRDPLRTAVLAEAELRGLVPHSAPQGAPRRDVAEQLVTAGLHALARRHHPDVGGNVRTMQDVTTVASWLRARARELA